MQVDKPTQTFTLLIAIVTSISLNSKHLKSNEIFVSEKNAALCPTFCLASFRFAKEKTVKDGRVEISLQQVVQMCLTENTNTEQRVEVFAYCGPFRHIKKENMNTKQRS